MFQHSLVSLFWGHRTVYKFSRVATIVSALSGESILGPPADVFRIARTERSFSTLW